MKNKSAPPKEDGPPKQNTLFHFFKKQNETSLPVIKVTCPGCDQLVPKSRINLHLDSDCVSKKKQGKKIKKSIKKNSKTDVEIIKPKIKNILSDDDDDFFEEGRCSSPVLFDLKKEENEPLKEESGIYFSPSMIKTEIFEVEVSLSPTTKATTSMLQNDWNSDNSSFNDSPVKQTSFASSIKNEPPTVSNKSPSQIGESTAGTSKRNDNDANINVDVDSNSSGLYSPIVSPNLVSPYRTPTPSPKLSHLSNKGNHDVSLSDDEFEPDKTVFRTPKQSPKKMMKRTPNSTRELDFSKIFEKESPDACFSQIKISPSIKKNANRYAFNKELTKIDNENNSPINKSSPSKRSPGTPRSLLKSLRNTGCLQNSQLPSSFVRVQKNLTNKFNLESEDGLPSSQPTSPNKDKAAFREVRGIYLNNFLLILDDVTSQEDDLELFNEEEKCFFGTFRELSLQAQKLYVRLFQRNVKWNKASSIDYKDICDKQDIILYLKELTYAEFLFNEDRLDDLEETLNILSVAEVKKICKEMKVGCSGKKEDLITSLIIFTRQQKSAFSLFNGKDMQKNVILKKAKSLIKDCFIINSEVRKVFRRVIMLYSLPKYDEDEEGGAQAQLTTLLMVGLGKLQFPSYKSSRHAKVFHSRDDLVRFEGFSQLENDVRQSFENHDWGEALFSSQTALKSFEELIKNEEIVRHDKSLPVFLRKFTSLSILIHILTFKVEIHQKMKDYKAAVEQLEMLLSQETYLQDYRGRWYDRLALNLQQHLKKPREAADVIEKALKDPEVRVGHRLNLVIRAQRMLQSPKNKQLFDHLLQLPLESPKEAPKVVIEGRCLPSDIPGMKRVFIRQDSGFNASDGSITCCSVEELVIGYYRKLGYNKGLHKEGITVNSLFGILFWDCIYADINDAFRSSHQAAPLDLDSSHFYEARKDMIDERLDKLRRVWSLSDAGKEIEKVWKENHGCISLVSWDIFHDADHVKGLLFALGLKESAAICERLAKDHRFTRSGFPDLIMWNPIEKKCKIIEVKGPNDRLSTKQMLWLDYLLKNDIAAVVCHVDEIGTKRMKKISPKKSPMKKFSPKKSPQKLVTTPPKSRKKPERKNNRQKINEEEDEDEVTEQSLDETIKASEPKGKSKRKTFSLEESEPLLPAKKINKRN